jgi:hypothetical protein
MTRDSFHAHRSDVKPHDHAVLVYDDLTDLLVPLGHFIAGGVQARDLSVFVHSFAGNDEARAFLRGKLADAPRHEADGDLATARYAESFERAGRIDRDHVAGVVQMLHQTAKGSNRRAPRIFVDASKNYLDAGRADEWFGFEAWLGPTLQAEAGLVCAYRAQDLRDPDVRRVLETHAYRFDVPGARLR